MDMVKLGPRITEIQCRFCGKMIPMSTTEQQFGVPISFFDKKPYKLYKKL